MGLLQRGNTMTQDLKDLIDNIHQLAMNSRDISEVSRMVGTIHALDEALSTLTRERDYALLERDSARRRVCSELLNRGVVFHRIGATSVAVTKVSEVAAMMKWDCFKEEGTA